MARLSPFPIMQFFDDNGDPLAGGFIYTYAAGTTDPKDTYVNSSGTTANSNPIELNSAGRVTNTSYAVGLWLGEGNYKFVLKDADENTIWTLDNITGDESTQSADTLTALKALQAGIADVVFLKGYAENGDGGEGWFYWDSTSTASGDDGIIVTPDSAPATGRWIRFIENGEIRVEWYGAAGDGTTNDTPAFSAADGYADTYDLPIKLAPKTYYLASNPSVATEIIMPPGAVLKYGGTSAFNCLIDEGDTTQHFEFDATYYPLLSRLKTVRPEWFGAVANGTTDCTEAIQQAIKSIALGGTVLFTGGSYLTTDTIDVSPNVTMKGQGREYSYINRSSSTGSCLNIPQTTTRWRIEGLAIHSDTDSSGYGCLCEYDTENVELHDVKFSGFKYGLWIYSGEDFNFQSVLFDCNDIANSIGCELGNPADSTYKSVNKVLMSNVHFKDCANIGLYCNRADSVTLIGAEFNDCPTAIKTSMKLTGIGCRFADCDTYIVDNFTTSSPSSSTGDVTLIHPYAEVSGTAVTDLRAYIDGGSCRVVTTGDSAVQTVAGGLIERLDVYSDTVTHSPVVAMGKSAADSQTVTETVTNDVLGEMRFDGVNATPARVTGASIKAIQNDSAGTNYIYTKLKTFLGSDTAAPAEVHNLLYPYNNFDTAMSLMWRDTGGVTLSQVTVGELDSGGDGYRSLVVPDASGTPGMRGPVWKKFTLDYEDFSADDTTKVVVPYALPIGGVIHAVCVKETTQFTGGSISLIQVEIGNPDDDDKYMGIFNFGTVSDTTFKMSNCGLVVEDFGSTTNINVLMTATGGNLSTLTQGAMSLWILVSGIA